MKYLSLLLAACGLLLSGCMLLPKATGETNTYTVEEEFRDVEVRTSSFDIEVLPSEDDTCRVVCKELDIYHFLVSVEHNTLYIRPEKDSGHFNARNIPLRIEVYLPEPVYRSLHLKTSSGDIIVPGGFQFEKIYLRTSSGNIWLNETAIEGQLNVKTSSGNVHFDRCDAYDIYVDTSSGDVTGTLLTGKNFKTKTSSGDVDVPPAMRGEGDCEITTSSGDIEIKVE